MACYVHILSELNISDNSDGIIELKKKKKEIGKNYFKNKGEKLIDLSITPNRPDCLGKSLSKRLSFSRFRKIF